MGCASSDLAATVEYNDRHTESHSLPLVKPQEFAKAPKNSIPVAETVLVPETVLIPERVLNPNSPPPPKRVQMKDMKEATTGFSKFNFIGEGTFGTVYRGMMIDPASDKFKTVAVAVKKLNKYIIFDGCKTYLREVMILDELQHVNLIRLVAYTHEKNEACLAYELCERGSLADNIAAGINGGEVLPWEARISIAIGVAKGLSVMHENNIIHRALKSTNILLTQDFVPKVTDFALARAGPDGDQKHISTRVLGDSGYLDPAYIESGQLTVKTDVYSFGVILLELITGRPSIQEWVSLAQMLRPHLEVKDPDLWEFVDPTIENEAPQAGVHRLTLIARACVNRDIVDRPSMKEVLGALQRAFS